MGDLVRLFWYWHPRWWLLRLCVNIFNLTRGSACSLSYFLNHRLLNLWLIWPSPWLILHWRRLSLIKIYWPALITRRIYSLLIAVRIWLSSSWGNSVSIIWNRFVLVRPWTRSRSWTWSYILLIIQITTGWHFCCSHRRILVNLIWIGFVIYSWLWLSTVVRGIPINALEFIKLVDTQVRFHKFFPLLFFLLPQ